MTIDPVCGMEVPLHPPTDSVRYESRTYQFCSAACREQFVQDPAQYAEKLAALQPPADMQ